VGQVTGKIYWQYVVSYGVISFVALLVLWSSEQVGVCVGVWVNGFGGVSGWVGRWVGGHDLVGEQAGEQAGGQARRPHPAHRTQAVPFSCWPSSEPGGKDNGSSHSCLPCTTCTAAPLHPCHCHTPASPYTPFTLQTLRILTSWYLSKWSSAEVMANMTGGSVDRIHYIGGYLGFALGEWAGLV